MSHVKAGQHVGTCSLEATVCHVLKTAARSFGDFPGSSYGLSVLCGGKSVLT